MSIRCTRTGSERDRYRLFKRWYDQERVARLPISSHALPPDWGEGQRVHDDAKAWMNVLSDLQNEVDTSDLAHDVVYVVGFFRDNEYKSGLVLTLTKNREGNNGRKPAVPRFIESGLTLDSFRRHVREIRDNHPIAEAHVVVDSHPTT